MCCQTRQLRNNLQYNLSLIMHQILWQQQKTCLRNRHRIAHIANSMETHWTGPKSIQ